MEMKVCCLMTAPRYTATFARNTIDTSLRAIGIPLTCSGGVFYGQCMQRMMEEVLEQNEANIIITVDSDTVIVPRDVKQLLNRMASCPEIDALAALQSRRGIKYPLFTRGSNTEARFEGEPVQVTTAHFGLTAIRVDSLRKIERPYFVGKPNDEGSWGDGRIDDDIWFWKQWREAGNTVYVDPNVSIGHYEEVVAYFDEAGHHQFAYPMDYVEMAAKRGTECTS